MAQVVYTHIDKIEYQPTAKWSAGIQDSYAETQRIADGGRSAQRLHCRAIVFERDWWCMGCNGLLSVAASGF